jgi:outer membrane PBP1 activator LpoA protein
MAGNLLHGDIKKTIHDELGEFITSVDKKFASWEKGNKALSQAQAAFDAELERLDAGLERLDAAADEAKAEKIINRMCEIALEDVGQAFVTLLRARLELAKDYIFG